MGRRSAQNPIDWELIEKDFRLGQSTLRQLAATHKVQPSAISRRAKKFGWVQDKREEVRARTEAQLVLADAKSKDSTPTAVDIEVAATVRKDVVLNHRRDIGRARTLVVKMLVELEAVTDDPAALHDALDLLERNLPDDEAKKSALTKLEEKVRRATDLGGRAATMKSIAESLQKLVGLEREAFGLSSQDDNPNATNFAEELIRARARTGK